MAADKVPPKPKVRKAVDKPVGEVVENAHIDQLVDDAKAAMATTFTYRTKGGELIKLPLTGFDLPDLTNPADRVWLYVTLAESDGPGQIKLWFDRAGVSLDERAKFFSADPEEWETIVQKWVSAVTDGVSLGE